MAGQASGRSGSRPVSRVLSKAAIHLRRTSPHACSDLPGSGAGHASSPVGDALPYLVLLRVGFTLPPVLPPARCALTAPFHPYLASSRTYRAFCAGRSRAEARTRGGLFSVALSVGSRPPGVTWHPALRSPDFPPPHVEAATARSTPAGHSVTRERRVSSTWPCPPPGARASRPQWAEDPPVFKRARCPRSQESIDAQRSFLGARASRPHVGRRPTGVQAGKMPAIPGEHRCGAVFPGSAGVPPAVGRRPTMVQAGKMPAIPGEHRCGAVFPGSAGVPPASGPQAHNGSSGQDARDPGRASMRCGLSWERGRPARKWAAGPQWFKRARCPRSQELPACGRRSRPGPVRTPHLRIRARTDRARIPPAPIIRDPEPPPTPARGDTARSAAARSAVPRPPPSAVP